MSGEVTLDLFCKAMDGRWVVDRVEPRDNVRSQVFYRSLDYPLIEWSHSPFHPEIIPAVGTVGRIGFVGVSP